MRARNVLGFLTLSLAVLALAIDGCGGSAAKPIGTLGAACYAD